MQERQAPQAATDQVHRFSPRTLRIVWSAVLIGAAVLLTILTFSPEVDIASRFSGTAGFFVVMMVVAFFAEYVDSSLGMGYGTTLTPLLMILGYSPLQVVPAVLLSEFLSGITSGALHHRLGNVDLRRGTVARKTMTILTLCSLVGTFAAVLLAVSLPKVYVKTYIGVMILTMGLIILIVRPSGGLSWKRIVGIGTVAAFNKGISGGGYGPVVTGGQILSGVPAKSAVGITSAAEGLVCAVGLTLYLLLRQQIEVGLMLPLLFGALLSVPAAAWTVKAMPATRMRRTIGYATAFLGALTLVRIIL